VPTPDQKRVIEELQLGLRIVDENGTLLSGSLYLLFPVEGDWDARLQRTAEIVKAAAAPGKTLYLLRDCGTCALTSADGFDGGSFAYGRTAASGPVEIARASLYGNEEVVTVKNWILRGITQRVPTQAVALTIAPTVAATPQASAFASCINGLAYIFSCCKPGYAQVDDEELDLT